MASNLELSELERCVMDYVKSHSGTGPVEIWAYLNNNSRVSSPMIEIKQAIASLISKSMIVGSSDTPICYSVVGGEL